METETNWGPRRRVYALGVDPGTTTGLALLGVQTGGPPEAIWADQLGWEEACAAVESKLEKMRRSLDAGSAIAVVAVCERYVINQQTARRGQTGAEDALGMIGVVRRNCQLTGVEFAKPQAASAAKNLLQDAALRNLQLYAPGLGHVNDAYRHAALLAVSRGWLNPKRLIESR